MTMQGGGGFEWDEENILHATRHGFSVEEIEAALNDPLGREFPSRPVPGEPRYGRHPRYHLYDPWGSRSPH
jgi:hypothetical protein